MIRIRPHSLRVKMQERRIAPLKTRPTQERRNAAVAEQNRRYWNVTVIGEAVQAA